MASDALGTALRAMAKAGEPIPQPATAEAPGLVPIELGVDDVLKLSVIQALRESGLSKTELGRRIGRADSEVHRIIDPNHATKAATMQQCWPCSASA